MKPKFRTQLIASAAMLAALGVVTACGVDTDVEEQEAPNPSVVEINGTVGDGKLYVKEIQVDGKTVSCVVYDGYKAGGVSCAFEGVRAQ